MVTRVIESHAKIFLKKIKLARKYERYLIKP